MSRALLLIVCGLLLVVAQLRRDANVATLSLATEPNVPVRVYLSKSDRSFRLHPVDAILPLKIDLFYRDTMWRAKPDPRTIELVNNEQSHFYLLDGSATFTLPAGDYKIEAFRGTLYEPASSTFTLKAGETRRVVLPMKRWAAGDWISADDHIHLPRQPADDRAFLKLLAAEDLSVGMFLQLQRQIDAAPQYGFGPQAEAKMPGYSIRSGQESRAEYYGHINLLGGRELVRPLSVGAMYANEPNASPFPALLFDRGKKVGALRGFAHFHGSMTHSTLPMDLALGNLDFLEVFQFGKLWTTEWYELLNAGFVVTGIAGSDFPVPLGRSVPWPKWLPLLGPERALVKGRPSASAYESWAEGVRRGEVVVSNGPLVELTRNGETLSATASFWRPLESIEIVRNGVVVATIKGDGAKRSLSVTATAGAESAWFAARTKARKEEGEPDILGHTNPRYVLRDGKPAMVRAAREAYAKRWRAEVEYYKNANLPFATAAQRDEFFAYCERARSALEVY